MYIPRLQEKNIRKFLKLKKVIYVVGARQVGKTTLIKMMSHTFEQPVKFFTGDDSTVVNYFSTHNLTLLKQIIGQARTVIIDEAHLIPNIGRSLKLLRDNFPDLNILCTGSSSIELTDKISQPLTGRKVDIELYPLTFKEMVDYSSLISEKALLEHRLIYGYYPEVVQKPGYERDLLNLLVKEYLLKDVFKLAVIKKAYLLENLLTALALQVGSEVSYNELAQLLSTDKETVMRYIYLLEQAYIIFKLPAFSRNLRNEIKRLRKIYFYDNGVRNALISNFNPLAKRNDIGALWENFLLSERRKMLVYNGKYANMYFWRTRGKAEIDYVEEVEGKLKAYEFKWARSRKSLPKSFETEYKVRVNVVTRENYVDFVLLND